MIAFEFGKYPKMSLISLFVSLDEFRLTHDTAKQPPTDEGSSSPLLAACIAMTAAARKSNAVDQLFWSARTDCPGNLKPRPKTTN